MGVREYEAERKEFEKPRILNIEWNSDDMEENTVTDISKSTGWNEKILERSWSLIRTYRTYLQY